MRFVSFAVMVAALAGCAGGGRGSTEVLVASKDYGFSVEFPGTPQYTQTPAQNGLLERGTWAVDGQEASLTVAAQRLRGAPPAAFARTVLDALVREYEKHSAGEVVSRQETTFLGGPAVDVVQRVDGGEKRARLVVLGDHQYEIGVLAKGGDAEPKDYEHLLDTFRRLPA